MDFRIHNSQTRIIVILTFLFIFLSASYAITNDLFSSRTTIILWVLILLAALIKVKQIKRNVLYVMVALLACIWITNIVLGENFVVTLKTSFSFITAFLFVQAFGFSEFKRAYIKVMTFICAYSIICYIAFLIFPGLAKINLVANSPSHISNWILYVHYGGMSIPRNRSLFWEPGAFQTFITIAMLLELSEKQYDVKRIILFSLCIISTFSTIGYIALIMFFLALFSNRKTQSKKRRFIITVFAAALLLLAFANSDKLMGSSSVFGKISTFFNLNESSGIRVSSASVRYFALIKPISAFFDSPFIGNGYQGLISKTFQYTLGMNTCTFVNWFAVYGLVFGILMTIGYVRFSSLLFKDKDISTKIIIMAILFLVISTENYVNNAFLMALILYGFDNNRKRELDID